MPFSRILVGLDRSELSPEVFSRSLALAQAFQAQLHPCDQESPDREGPSRAMKDATEQRDGTQQ